MPEHSAKEASTMPWTSTQKLVPISGSFSSNGTCPTASFAFDCQVAEHHLIDQLGDAFDIDPCRHVLLTRCILRLRSIRRGHSKLIHKHLVVLVRRTELAVDPADLFDPLPALGVLEL